MQYKNHSGGAVGSDYQWGKQGEKYGVVSLHYWHGKKTPYGNYEISEKDFEEGKKHVLKANKTLKRKPEKYMDLLARNYIQVKNSDAVFAIADKIEKNIVSGGTGWAVQMAIEDKKPVFVFLQHIDKWVTYVETGWMYYPFTPKLTINFAGIGTRQINDAGIKAIEEVYKETFER